MKPQTSAPLFVKMIEKNVACPGPLYTSCQDTRTARAVLEHRVTLAPLLPKTATAYQKQVTTISVSLALRVPLHVME